MIGPIVRHPRIVVILEVDCSAEDGPVPRDHFIQAVRLEGDMMQRGFDDRHCRPPKTFSIAHRNRYRGSPPTAGSRALLVNFRSNRCARGKVPWMACPLWVKRWGNRPALLWIAKDFGCCQKQTLPAFRARQESGYRTSC